MSFMAERQIKQNPNKGVTDTNGANGAEHPEPTPSAPEPHRFQAGESGNRAGRPKGARSKLSDAFLKALADDFLEHGEGVIQKVREERPHDYLKIIASSLPKQIELGSDKPAREMTDEELMAIVRGSKYLEPDPKGEEQGACWCPQARRHYYSCSATLMDVG
jgi:Family of unknown function (DUF5681)